jgi:glycosyltransferase involved in cell wall biosynthesis
VRLLFLSPTGRYGGAEAALFELLAGLRERCPNWRLSVVAASEGPLVDRVRALGVTATVVPFPARLAQVGEWAAGASNWGWLRLAAACLGAAGGAIGYWWRLRRVVAAQAPDIVQSNGVKMHLLSVFVAPRRSAVVWHVHDYLSQRSVSSRALRALAGWCAAVVANSDSVARDLQRVLGPQVRIHRVWNAVDLDRYSHLGPALDLDRLAGLPAPGSGVTRVGLVATFARWKGHAAFLRALSLLPETLGVRGYIVGGPVYTTGASQVSLDELRTLAGEQGLAGRVGFVGYVPDTAAAMRALDVVVHASTEPEPFGLVIAEAMACRRAVVASASGGAAELIDPGVTALSHEPGDVSGLADRIRILVADAALRARLASAAREAAEHAFTRTRMVGELLPMYQRLAPKGT